VVFVGGVPSVRPFQGKRRLVTHTILKKIMDRPTREPALKDSPKKSIPHRRPKTGIKKATLRVFVGPILFIRKK
jgi:hypothetical protein